MTLKISKHSKVSQIVASGDRMYHAKERISLLFSIVVGIK